MSIIKSMRRQKAVWWERLGTDRYGSPAFATPVEVPCRWEDVAEEFLTAAGTKSVSNAVVYVDREMKVGDRLVKGAMESATPNDPIQQAGSHEIARFNQLPNLKNTETLFTAYL